MEISLSEDNPKVCFRPNSYCHYWFETLESGRLVWSCPPYGIGDVRQEAQKGTEMFPFSFFEGFSNIGFLFIFVFQDLYNLRLLLVLRRITS